MTFHFYELHLICVWNTKKHNVGIQTVKIFSPGNKFLVIKIPGNVVGDDLTNSIFEAKCLFT